MSTEMNVLQFRLHELMPKLDREFRVPVSVAFKMSDGSFSSFAAELTAQTWDYPSLPVQQILDTISYDLA